MSNLPDSKELQQIMDSYHAGGYGDEYEEILVLISKQREQARQEALYSFEEVAEDPYYTKQDIINWIAGEKLGDVSTAPKEENKNELD